MVHCKEVLTTYLKSIISPFPLEPQQTRNKRSMKIYLHHSDPTWCDSDINGGNFRHERDDPRHICIK